MDSQQQPISFAQGDEFLLNGESGLGASLETLHGLLTWYASSCTSERGLKNKSGKTQVLKSAASSGPRKMLAASRGAIQVDSGLPSRCAPGHYGEMPCLHLYEGNTPILYAPIPMDCHIEVRPEGIRPVNRTSQKPQKQ